MATFVRSLGSLIRGESSYSNEQDPWENDVPLSFQSARRETHAKPPPSLRIPRVMTLPNLRSFLPRGRIQGSSDQHDAGVSNRSVPPSSQRVTDEYRGVEPVPPAIMNRSFIGQRNKAMASLSKASRSFIWRNKGGRESMQTRKKKPEEELGEDDVKATGHVTNRDLEDIPPTSPISEDAENEEGVLSRRDWLGGRVRRMLRLRRREHA